MIRLCAWTMAALAFGIAAAGAHAPSRSPFPEPRVAAMPAPADLPAAASVTAQTAPAGATRPAPRPAATGHAAPAAVATPQSEPDPAPLRSAGLGSLFIGAAEAAPPGLARLAQPATPRPLPRQQAAVVPARAASSVTLSASGAVASRLAVNRSPLPPRRSETARRRHLESLQRAAAVRTQPVPPAITGQAGAGLCGVPGIQGRTLAPITAAVQACGVANPVQVTAVDGVRLSQPATVECDTARALHRWVREGLKPAVGGAGGGVVELRVAAHYVCRTQNHRRNAPVSEHGRGRAIDISGIRLADGQLLTVLRDWRSSTWGPILRQAHRAACGTFTTTLGPGSDGMHEDHFHYDTARRNMPAICR